ncbi:alpha/beta hydrolase family esterase [Bosea sp. NPDC055332]
MARLSFLSALLFGFASTAAQACGSQAEPCKVALGDYHAAVPAAAPPRGEKRPAVLFFHGAGGGGDAVLASDSVLRPFVEAGYVVLGPNGLVMQGSRYGRGWSFLPDAPQQRDELAFTQQVLDDAATRFDIDRKRVLIGGFSIGASLTWYLACRQPDLGAAYVPLAGNFWRPHPTRCAGPVDILQTHGWRDEVFPLEGRQLGPNHAQGDVFEGLQLWRATNGCKTTRPDSIEVRGPVWQRSWTNCESGRQVSLMLHAGGHEDPPKEWAEQARHWFEARLKARPAAN